MGQPFSAGSLYSTVEDLYRWDRALNGTKVLSEASKKAAWTPYLEKYGYGWVIDERNGKQWISHGGGINGFNTQMARQRDLDAVVIVLNNYSDGGNVGRLARELSGILSGEKVALPVERKYITLAPEKLTPLAGKYQMGPLTVDITVEDGKLMVQPAGQGKAPFQAESETKFYFAQVDAEITFALGEDGKAKEFTLVQGGGRMLAKRVP
jgi:hypothetical protein